MGASAQTFPKDLFPRKKTPMFHQVFGMCKFGSNVTHPRGHVESPHKIYGTLKSPT